MDLRDGTRSVGGHPREATRTPVVLTPHIAGLTAECAEHMAIGSVQNVLDYFNGSIDPTLVVNRDQLNAAKVR